MTFGGPYKRDVLHALSFYGSMTWLKTPSDLSDEAGCPPRFDDGRYCSEDKFQCDNHLCVRHTDLCDGRDDCGDGSDEDEEMCKTFTCDNVHKFQCSNYKVCVNEFDNISE